MTLLVFFKISLEINTRNTDQPVLDITLKREITVEENCSETFDSIKSREV